MSNEKITGIANRIIGIGFVLLFGLVPLLLTPWNYELFEFNKMVTVYGLTAVIGGAWLMKILAEKEIKIARTPLDIPIILFFASQLVSALFSLDPHVSWFGYYSRFNGGMWSVICYILLYYAFVSNWSKENNGANLSNLLKISLSTATIVAIYGVLERLGIDKKLWVQDVQNRVFSTLGQPNWLAAYLAALIPLTISFVLKAQSGKRLAFWIWSLITTLFFLVLLFTRSRSGLLGFAVADVVFWGLIVTTLPREPKSPKKTVFQTFLLLHVVFILIVFVNGSGVALLDRYFTLQSWKDRILPLPAQSATNAPPVYAAPLLEVGGTESGKIRKYVWQAALTAWRANPKNLLIGTGTETFTLAFYRWRPKEHNLTSEWDFLYNKAHNEYLNFLTTTGVLGLGSYLLFIGTFIIWFIKARMSKPQVQIKSKAQSLSRLDFDIDLAFEFRILSFALFTGWMSILITNFFGFSVVVVQLFLFLFPAMIFISMGENLEASSRKIPSWVTYTYWPKIAIALLTVFLLYVIGKYWYADTLFARGYRLSRANLFPQSQNLLLTATRLNPGEPFYHDELGTTLAALAAEAMKQQNATAAATLAKQSLSESDRALAESALNVNFWKSRAKVFYTFSSFDPQFLPATLTVLKKAWELSPADPKIVYNLAILYGRQGDNNQAIELLKTTISLKPNYRDAYWALYLFYSDVKQANLAKATLQEYLDKVDPKDQEFLARIE